MSHYLKKGILAVLLLYAAYLLIAGVFSYLWPTPVKEEDRERFNAADLLGDGTEGVDRAALVEDEHDAFSRRIELIRSAKRELDVCCHCAKAGETVDCLFAELLKAAGRGVKVRILMDGTVSGMKISNSGIITPSTCWSRGSGMSCCTTNS